LDIIIFKVILINKKLVGDFDDFDLNENRKITTGNFNLTSNGNPDFESEYIGDSGGFESSVDSTAEPTSNGESKSTGGTTSEGEPLLNTE
jgi:hypothetical protein